MLKKENKYTSLEYTIASGDPFVKSLTRNMSADKQKAVWRRYAQIVLRNRNYGRTARVASEYIKTKESEPAMKKTAISNKLLGAAVNKAGKMHKIYEGMAEDLYTSLHRTPTFLHNPQQMLKDMHKYDQRGLKKHEQMISFRNELDKRLTNV
jgi:hypothetical protein